jgi:hypothetical protein
VINTHWPKGIDDRLLDLFGRFCRGIPLLDTLQHGVRFVDLLLRQSAGFDNDLTALELNTLDNAVDLPLDYLFLLFDESGPHRGGAVLEFVIPADDVQKDNKNHQTG